MDDIKFFYLLKNVSQLTFDGQSHVVSVPIGKCHIVYQGSLLCEKNRDVLKRNEDASRVSEVRYRPEGVPLCEKCEKKFKSHPRLPWSRWVKLDGVK